ncbi:MAG: pre-peptidase C-terminal domain-containing protein [Terricaulis sp.]
MRMRELLPSEDHELGLAVQPMASLLRGPEALLQNPGPLADGVDIAGNATTTETLTIDGPSAQSTIDVAGDTDWFAVQLVAGESYQFSVTGSTLSDPFLTVYNANGAPNSVDDDGGAGSNSLMHFTALTTGTYYLSAEGFDGAVGDYTITAAHGPAQNPLDTLDLGFELSAASTRIVEVYFATSGQHFAPSGTASRSFTASEQAQVMSALRTISNFTNIAFFQTSTPTGADITFTLNSLGPGVLGQTFPGAAHGYIEFDPNKPGWTTAGLAPGGLGYSVILHEVGHALGLDHPFEDGLDNQIMQGVLDAFDSYGAFLLNQQVFTIMSYNDGWPLGPTGAPHTNNFGYAQTMMALDIAALQQRYGANTTFNNTDNTYFLNDSTTSGGYRAIWDTGGSDTITYEGGFNAIIDLRPATLLSEIGGGGFMSYVDASTFSGFTIANGVVIENGAGGSGNDTITGNDAANTLTGNFGQDTLLGGNGDDVLLGGTGDDTLNGGAGADAMTGGDGSDSYFIDNAGDTITELATDTGVDVVTVSLDYILADNVENAFLTGAAALLTGNSGNNTITGDDLNNTLSGLDGNDSLLGGAGDDILIGGAGADFMQGDTGFDIADYSGAASGISVDVTGPGAHGGDAEGDTLVGIEEIIGTAFNDTLGGLALMLGGAGDDTLRGYFGVNELHGGAGNDTLIGGQGADILDGGADTDTASYADSATGQGVSVDLTAGIGAGGDAQGDTLSGVENLIGSAFDDTLKGDGGANSLSGGDGNDVLIGAAGADALDGGAGVDIASYADAGAGLQASLAAPAGNTGIAAGDSYISIEGLFGSAFNDVLTGDDNANVLSGGAGNDILDGGLGADTMSGGIGNDTYIVDNTGDVVIEAGGTDVVQASVSYTIGNGVENLTLTGVGAINGTGNSISNVIAGTSAANTLSGLDGNDLLQGGGGDDTLIGGNGNDILVGGLGADQMSGGIGDDIYVVDNAADVVSEAGGNDLVQASISFTLGNGMESLALTGSAAIDGTGNALSNAITGNAGNNTLSGLDGNDGIIGGDGDDAIFGGNGADRLTGGNGNDYLDGGAGADQLSGGLGNDTYIVDNLGDTVTDNGGGFDTVLSSVSFSMGVGIEVLTLTGLSAINGVGNALSNQMSGNAGANTLTGNDGNDVLQGQDGDDVLIGGNGADVLIGGAGADTFVYQAASDSAAAAHDIIKDFQKGVDLIDLSAVHTDVSDAFFFTQSGSTSILHVDLGGNGADDMIININNTSGLTAADIIWGP